MTYAAPRYPGRAPIDAYGNGGFRFADMSHRGSILCLPSGIHAWPPAGPADITAPALAAALAEKDALGVLLLGTGQRQVFPDSDVREAFAAAADLARSAPAVLAGAITGAASLDFAVLKASRLMPR